MTEPTAEARERARFALGPWAERPVHSSMTARAELVANVARALDAFRRAGVEQAEKERDEIRTKAALRIEEARAEVRRVEVQAHNITLDNAQKIMHIAALEAELARVRKHRDVISEQVIGLNEAYLSFEARLSPERLERAAAEAGKAALVAAHEQRNKEAGTASVFIEHSTMVKAARVAVHVILQRELGER